MYKSTLLFLTLLFSASALAQPEHDPREFKRVEAYKTKFLTEELDLSPEEAQKFWPVYNEYNKKLQELFNNRTDNMSRREIRDKWDELDDSQLEATVLQELENQKKIAELKLDYYDNFKDSLGSRKAATFFKAEMEFHRHLMEMLGKKRKRRHWFFSTFSFLNILTILTFADP